MRKKLDVWPALPIVLEQYDGDWEPKSGVINVTAAFEQNNRICQIGLRGVSAWLMEEILVAMYRPFPLPSHLELQSIGETLATLVDPDLFLGGSAPRLRFLQLVYIPFPELPKLLISATQLTDLRLFNISHSGYISPEAMVSCLSALTKLERLILEFESPESFPVREHRPPPPPTRTLLPAFTWLQFRGVGEYLEDLVVQIDTPLLDNFNISLFRRFIPVTAQLTQFINRAPKLKAHNDAHVAFYQSRFHLTLGRESERGLGISHAVIDWHVFFVTQVCTSSLFQAFSATVERLYICDNYAWWQWRGNIPAETNHWVKLLRSFTSVKSLYLSRGIVPRIAPALQELIGGSVVGGLPALQTLFLEDLILSGPVQKTIKSFVSGRQFSGHPVAVSEWERKRCD